MNFIFSRLRVNKINLIFDEQFIIGSRRKTLHLTFKRNCSTVLNISFQTAFFKRLNFDYSSSETVSIQRIKLKAIVLEAAHFWRSD